MAWRVISVRLRFVLVLGAAFLVVSEWDVLRNYWSKFMRPVGALDPAGQSVSGDTEYFCPMDPGVLSDWPGKCPVCNMALVRRKKGEVAPLPSGVVARMQFSPYRLHLAGIRTAPVTYQALAREIEAPGTVVATSGERTEVEARAFARDAPLLADGLAAEVTCPALPDPTPLRATVRSVGTPPEADPDALLVHLEVDDPSRRLLPDGRVIVRIFVPIARIEPFRSMPTDPPPPREGEPRRVFACPEHADVLRDRPASCPVDRAALMPRDLDANQRLRWWCPMHPQVTADEPGRKCEACGGMILVPRVVFYNPPGQVLSVPEGAVVDTGTRRVVYLERMPGMFDGVEVDLGPRCGGAYPVVRGLEPGQRVATAGSFLIDAETRLNPGLAASYFGAGRGADAGAPLRSEVPRAEGRPAVSDELAPADRLLVARQKTCPVTGKPLGSMGPPTRLVVGGRSVFLCCKACEGTLEANPTPFLAKLPPDPAGGATGANREP